MMRPVGVGLTSRGPIGVDGLTMTAGSPSSAIIASTSRSAAILLRLYAPIPVLGTQRYGSRRRAAVGAQPSVATLLV